MGWIADLLKEFPALEVARERLALLEAKFADLEAESARLRDEVARLQRQNAALKRQVPTSDFVEAQGVLFRRKPDGRFQNVAYCPDCKRALSTLHDVMPPTCSKCHFMAPFYRDEIPRIIAELSG